MLCTEVPARKEQGDTEYQPSCRVEQHIAPDAMGDGKRCVDKKPTGQWNGNGVPGVRPAFYERTPGQQDDADHPARHHGADDAVGKPDVALGLTGHRNWDGRLVEVHQVEDGFPEARRQQQGQAQDDDDSRSGLD